MYAKQYGELCYMRVGPYPVVLISGAKMIRHMFVEHKALFSDRANFSPIDKFMAGGKGFFVFIVCNNVQYWLHYT